MNATKAFFWRSFTVLLALVLFLGMFVALGFASVRKANEAKDVFVWIDVQTNCQYIVTSDRRGITVRLGPDGRPLCGEGSFKLEQKKLAL